MADLVCVLACRPPLLRLVRTTPPVCWARDTVMIQDVINEVIKTEESNDGGTVVLTVDGVEAVHLGARGEMNQITIGRGNRR